MGAGSLPLWRFVRGRAGKTPVRSLLHQKPIADARRSHPARNGAHCAVRAFLTMKGIMNINNLVSHMGRFGVACALIVAACALQPRQSFAQTPAPSAGAQIEDDSFFRDIYR